MEENLSGSQRQEIEELVREANSKLAEVGSESAEQSFGLGCLLGGLVIVGIIGFLYIAGTLNIIIASIILVMGLVGVTGVASLSASFARSHRSNETYRLLVGPEIERYQTHKNLSRSDLLDVADEVLSEDAPLRSYLKNSQE
jgi:hypothetical protein